jgi:hypothetical protein
MNTKIIDNITDELLTQEESEILKNYIKVLFDKENEEIVRMSINIRPDTNSIFGSQLYVFIVIKSKSKEDLFQIISDNEIRINFEIRSVFFDKNINEAEIHRFCEIELQTLKQLIGI